MWPFKKKPKPLSEPLDFWVELPKDPFGPDGPQWQGPEGHFRLNTDGTFEHLEEGENIAT